MRYIGFIFALCLSIQAIASNTITLSSVSGTPQTEVEVVVSLDNTDAIVALEMVLPLGEHLSYVTNSAVLATARSNGHMLSAAQVGQELRIYVYSFSQNTLNGNTGELLTFRLKLGEEPAEYALTPTVVLSDAAGASIDGSVQAGSVAIQAPKLQIVNLQIDYGHIPIRATYTKNLQLKNVGNLPLVIEDITTTDPLLMPQQTALTIEAGQTASISIEYAPVVRGAISKEVIVKSNAINGDQVATIIADPFSVNELHVGSASGIADSIVTISLTMNNMEPIVAMQCAFKLPKQLEYVANSLVINATRNNGHQALSMLRGDTLYMAIFSMGNQALHANDGEVVTFQLRLNGSSGTYYLKPIDVVLSNITEENMLSATSQGKVTIKAPSISGNTSLSFGNIPITEVAHATYSVRNNGSAPLVLERATFLAEGYNVVEELPITIATSKTTTITVAYQPAEEGDFRTTMNLYTNDPNNRLKTVELSGSVYEPNVLTLAGENDEDGSYTLSVGLDNYTEIVGVQYDIHWLGEMQTAQSSFAPSSRMADYMYVVTPLDDNSYRVFFFSMTNTPIYGHTGEVHTLRFTPENSNINYCGSEITIDNVVISSVTGLDKSSMTNLSYTANQNKWGIETVATCDAYTWKGNTYTQSGLYTDTTISSIGCDSIVTLHLTIHHGDTTHFEQTAIGQYTWHGHSYTESGIYDYLTQTQHGCDSLEILQLTIIPQLVVTDEDGANNTAALSPYNNTMAEVTLVRPLQLNHWNTIALPFSLDNEQIRQVFGEGTQVAILTDSYLKSENSVYVEFDYVNTIEAGKPYLIMPIQQASSPILTTINTSANTITTSIVDMIPVLDETQWQASEYNFFLGPDAYLYQNALDGTMPALRAYFQFHHLTPQQLAHIRAHVAFNENGTTKVENIVNPPLQNEVQKIIEDNQLYIIRNGVKYTIHGLRAK